MTEKCALLSVYNKEGIVDFAKALVESGYTILSTGGTSRALKESSIEVTDISSYTGQPEILDGRVKTLHPKVFGGILADFSNDEHKKQMDQQGFSAIGLVCVNLYPFLETLQRTSALKEILENIDVGGPSMIRAAAKNYKQTLVVTDPDDYTSVIDALKNNTDDSKFRLSLASKAFSMTARYDVIINHYFVKTLEEKEFPEFYNFTYEKIQDLRYGENPHQRAALYKPYMILESGVATAKQLHGRELSYNNVLDGDEALNIIKDFDIPTAAVIKHNNPSGVASDQTIAEAYQKAHDADPKSAYGSVVAFNRPCDKDAARFMKDKFVELVICPSFEEEALRILQEKKNIRLLTLGDITTNYSQPEVRNVASGLLVQSRQFPTISEKDLKVVTGKKPTGQEIKDMLFAWKVNKHVKSNSIVFAKNQTTVGIGAGQMSRVDAVNLMQIKEEAHPLGSVMSSDAYFPFRDGLDQAVKLGITAIIQPGGSIRDQEVIDAANEHDIAMVFTGIRLFKH